MNLLLRRELRGTDYVAGALYVNGVFECWTLEDAERDLKDCKGKVKQKTAIPLGKYTMVLSYSGRFQKYLPELLSVPCFSGIRIHSGNSPEDTDGCILVGAEKSASGKVFKSRVAFDALMKKLNGANRKEKFTIEVR